MLIAVDTNILMDLAAEAESRIGLDGAPKPVPSARCANKQCLKADQKHRTHYPPERISQAMQFLHVLTAKKPAEKPHAIHRNQQCQKGRTARGLQGVED